MSFSEESTTRDLPVLAPAEVAAADPRGLLTTAALLFIVSGSCGLMYQVLWLRLLGLVFGVTVYAVSTVLASFMGGLALGSALGGRLADRARRPLLWYAVAEAFVGASALSTPVALEGVGKLYVWLHPLIGDDLGRLTLFRFVLSSLVLLVPTTLMGATFPILVRSAVLDSGRLGERAGVLYAANTAGGILGTLLAGFYLIGGVGIAASFRLAAALNMVVALAAVVASLVFERPTAAAGPVAGEIARDPRGVLPHNARHLVLWIFGVSGFASLALEVVWFRVLLLFLQVTTYAFTIMLATFLLGIAAGSAFITVLMKRWRMGLLFLGVLELGVAVASVLSLMTLGASYGVLSYLQPFVQHPSGRRGALMMVMSFLVLFPVTTLLGMAFPLGLRLWAVEREELSIPRGKRVGQFYSLNVLGSILGAVVGGFLLLPRLGSRGSIVGLAALFLLSGLLLLLALPGSRRRAAAWGLAGIVCFLMACRAAPDPFAVALAHRYPGERLLWQEEGAQTTVSVQEASQGTRMMYLDGLHQASDSPTMVNIHRRIGALALALRPHPRRALVIGLGGGVTAGSVARDERATVRVVELSEAVVRGAEQFRHVNHDVLHRPNVSLRVDDGRNFLLLTRERFDLITADIIQPHHAGAGNVYSAEYFSLARRALEDDGVMVQWIGLTSENHYKLLLRTFLSVFPEATLWADGSLVVGGRHPLTLDASAFEENLRDSTWRGALASVDITSFESLRSLYRAGPEALHRFVGPGPILTDDRPLLEYYLSLPGRGRVVDFSTLGEGGGDK